MASFRVLTAGMRNIRPLMATKKFQARSASVLSSSKVKMRYHAAIARKRLLSTSTHAGDDLTNTSDNNEKSAMVKLELREDMKVATLALDSPPTNALTLEVLREISSKIQSLENHHPQIQGLILKSNNPRIFSSGLHLSELHNPDPTRLKECWHAFQQVFVDLYGSRLATVAAIDGHAPAAGCLLALACDYRIMASSEHNAADAGTIGLNETMFGVVPPFWMFDLMARTIGFRNAEQAMTLGRLYSPEDALQHGLVDHLADHGHVVDESFREVKQLILHVDSETRRHCRIVTRMPFIQELERRRQEDIELFCSIVMSDAVQTKLTTYVERLKARKSKTATRL